MAAEHDKGKRLERKTGKWLLEHDGDCPKWGEMASSTGRVGHITELGVDIISHTYVAECKARKTVPAWFVGAWEQVLEKAMVHDKEPFMVVKKDRVKEMHIITAERHAELLKKEKERNNV